MEFCLGMEKKNGVPKHGNESMMGQCSAVSEKASGIGRCAAVCVLEAGPEPTLLHEQELSWANRTCTIVPPPPPALYEPQLGGAVKRFYPGQAKNHGGA